MKEFIIDILIIAGIITVGAPVEMVFPEYRNFIVGVMVSAGLSIGRVMERAK